MKPLVILCHKCKTVIQTEDKMSFFQKQALKGEQPPLLPKLCKICLKK